METTLASAVAQIEKAKQMTKDKRPSYADLIHPVLTALHDLGGIAGTFMIDEAVVENLKLPQELVEETHAEQNDHRYPRTEMSYRLAWARTYLKYYGLIENPERGLWQLTLAEGKSRP